MKRATVLNQISPSGSALDTFDGTNATSIKLGNLSRGLPALKGFANLSNLRLVKPYPWIGCPANVARLYSSARGLISHIVVTGAGFEMRSIAAWRIITGVKGVQRGIAVGVPKTNKAVDVNALLVPRNLPISTVVTTAGPRPALIRPAFINSRVYGALQRAVGLVPPCLAVSRFACGARLNQDRFCHTRTIAQPVYA